MSKSRNLSTLLGSDGSVKTTKYVDEKGGVAEFVASGILPNGVPVVLKDDGTVEAVGTVTTGSAQSIPAGAESLFNSGYTVYISGAADPNNANKFIVAYADGSNSYHGKVVVGTISGTTISFGTPVKFNAGSTNWTSISFDPNTPNQFIVAYPGVGNNGYGSTVVGTIAGTSISLGTVVVFNSGQIPEIFVEFDPSTAGKFVIAYKDNGNSYQCSLIAGTVSGTTPSFGSVVTISSGNTSNVGLKFDPNNAGKFVVIYKQNSTNQGEARVGTLTGTSISLGTSAVYNGITGEHLSLDFDTYTSKFVVAFRDQSNAHKGTAIVGTISGTTVSFGSKFVFDTVYSTYTKVAFDPTTSGRFVIAYKASDLGKTIVGTISGTNISFANADSFDTGTIDMIAVFFDSVTPGQFITVYMDNGNSGYGTAVVNRLSTPIVVSTNLTADNFIGMSSTSYSDGETATVTLAGSVSDNQTGLTTNSVYYVQTDGTLTTSAGTPIVEAGRAISSTSLLLTSEAGAAGPTGATGGFTEDYVLAEDMAAGSVAVINSLGKVESVTGVAAITASYYENATHTLSTNNLAQRGDIESDPLNDNRFAIVQANDTGCRITVATVSGTTITWGTTLLLKGGTYQHITPRISWDSNTASGRLAVYYTDYTGGVFSAYLSVVTVSGTTCTEQSQNMVGTGIEFGDLKWVPGVAGRLVYTQRDAKTLVMYNVSATHQTTYNSQVAFGGLDSNPARIMFFPDDGTKVVLMYGTSSGVAVRIATISSSAITLGTEQVITGASSSQGSYNRHGAIAFPYNDSSKVVFASEGIMAYNQYSAVAATISGDTFTFGDIVLIDTGGSDYSSEGLVMFNPFDSTNIIVSTNISTTSSNFQVLELTGTTLVKQLATVVATQGYSLLANLNDSGKFVMFRMDAGSAQISSYGVTGSTNVTSGKVAGLLTTTGTAGQTKPVQFIGRLDGFTGLTIGAEYYAQPVGGISTVNSIGSVLIGFAASETAIQIK